MPVDIKDIKPPVNFPPNYTLLIILGIILLAAAVFFLVRFLLRRIKKRAAIKAVSKKPAHIIAREALALLKGKNLPAQGKVKEYYIELSDIIRHYIEERFQISAPDMTTEEFLFNLYQADQLNQSHKELLKEFLNLCDIVKFAKYGPTEEEIEESFVAADRFIGETKLEQLPEQKGRIK